MVRAGAVRQLPGLEVGSVWRMERLKFERWIAKQAPKKSKRG
jgi:hypothetical protein